MEELRGLKTHANLKTAFILEAGAALRYLYFAKIAKFEGFPDVAKLFTELAECLVCNAHGNLDLLKRVGDPTTDLPIGFTESNVTAAIIAEKREYHELYPLFSSLAYDEGFPDIASWFETLAKHKTGHITKLEQMLQQITSSVASVIR